MPVLEGRNDKEMEYEKEMSFRQFIRSGRKDKVILVAASGW